MPKKPRGYKQEGWTLLTQLLQGNQLVAEENLGSKEQCDISNGLSTMITGLALIFSDEGRGQQCIQYV